MGVSKIRNDFVGKEPGNFGCIVCSSGRLYGPSKRLLSRNVLTKVNSDCLGSVIVFCGAAGRKWLPYLTDLKSFGGGK